ncbi:MAG: efflux RND transporter periplasmic adaptor subunit [Kiritimatiellales bacterium]
MKKFIFTVLILVLAGGGFWFYRQRQKEKTASAEAGKFMPAQVELKTLSLTIDSTGEVSPENRLEVKSPIAGRIEELLVDEGQPVQRGQIIAWVSSTERASLLDIARVKGETELKYWEEIYKATPLIAPLDGTVIDRSLEPGQTITASSAVIVIADRLIVVGSVDETDIGSVSPGQRVTVQLDAYPNSSFDATVESIAYDSKTVSNVTMYEVDVIPDKLPSFARSGMTATLTFLVEQHPDVPAVPTSAIQYRNGKTFILQPGASAEAPPQPRPVKTGLSENSYTEILRGLEPGDTVLIPQVTRSRSGGGGNPFLPFGSRKSSGTNSSQRQGGNSGSRSAPPPRP